MRNEELCAQAAFARWRYLPSRIFGERAKLRTYRLALDRECAEARRDHKRIAGLRRQIAAAEARIAGLEAQLSAAGSSRSNERTTT